MKWTECLQSSLDYTSCPCCSLPSFKTSLHLSLPVPGVGRTPITPFPFIPQCSCGRYAQYYHPHTHTHTAHPCAARKDQRTHMNNKRCGSQGMMRVLHAQLSNPSELARRRSPTAPRCCNIRPHRKLFPLVIFILVRVG